MVLRGVATFTPFTLNLISDCIRNGRKANFFSHYSSATSKELCALFQVGVNFQAWVAELTAEDLPH